MRDPLAVPEIFDMIPNILCRSIFILHIKWGMDDHEIAEIFNLDAEHIKIAREQTIEFLKDELCPPIDYPH